MNNLRPDKLALLCFFTFIFFSSTAQDIAPVLTASGNQTYCPGTPLNIVTAFNITDADDTGSNAIYIQIASGYQAGQDILSLTGSHPQITATWNATTAKLVLLGTGGDVPYTELIAAVNDVVYTNTAGTPATGTRTFSITVGEANYLPSTQHYYRFISNLGINWNAARTAAQNSTYYGLQGYLATLLSADEAQLCGEQATGTGWIGGSDSQGEGVWRWMTGPETGTIFWNGGVNGNTPNYAFWNTGEPNNQGEEDYAHITAPGVGIPGSWNDLTLNGGQGDFSPKGYIVEYGGMPGDPILQISASTSITVASIVSTSPGSRCGGGPVTLQGVASGSAVFWYSTATGGTPIQQGSSFTTPIITSSTTYYASVYDASCTAGTRTAVLATINPLPTITGGTNAFSCGGAPVTITATPSSGSVNWYSQPSGGTALATNTANFTTPQITTDTTFYAEAVNSEGCVSSNRAAVNVVIAPLPTITAITPPPLCGAGSAPLEAMPSAGIINWYTTATGGTAFATGNAITSPIVTATTTFYAEASFNTCTSTVRVPVTVTVIPQPVITAPQFVYVCVEGTATLTATVTMGTISWYDQPAGGTLLGTGNTITSPYITVDTIFYAEADNNTCLTASRTAVTAVITPLPTLVVTSPAQVCGSGTTVLEAAPSAVSGTINWYTEATGGDLIGTGLSITSPEITQDTVFYAEAVNNGCVSLQREPVIVNLYPLPIVAPDEDVVFCENGSTILEAGTTDVTYLWSTGETNPLITITEPGIYTVEVTNVNGCSAIRTFTTTTLPAPIITVVEVYSDRAKVIMQLNDPENYEYSLDQVHYQDSPLFINLNAGPHIAYARSRNGCGEYYYNFTVNMIPLFFTPNGDSINDVFSIAGMAEYPEASVRVYDRYGKLIIQLNSRNRSWDGTFNNAVLPATDYWYVLKLTNNSEELRGHFALIR